MTGKGTELQQFLSDEVSRYEGICMPVRTSLFRRLTTKQLPLSKLHPNPEDEFCDPDIGPNMGIISKYEADFRRFHGDRQEAAMSGSGVFEPIQVQKIRPDGYMILNGHHRWIAARRAGMKTIPVEIVNVTWDKDVRKLLSGVRHDRRVALDLDEVVFASAGEPAEKPLSFPWNRLYPQSVRLGIPSLFYFLHERQYDIWVYTSQLISDDQLRRLFRHHHAGSVYVITGIGRKSKPRRAASAMEKMIREKYPTTFHIDQRSVLKTSGADHAFEEFPLPGKAAWSREVQDVFRKQAQDG